LRADLVFARSLSRRQNFRSTPALVGSVSKNNRIAAAGEGAEGLNETPRARAGHPHAARLQFNWPLRLSICRPSSTNTPAAWAHRTGLPLCGPFRLPNRTVCADARGRDWPELRLWRLLSCR